MGAKSEILEISLVVEEHVATCAHIALPLSAAHLAQLAKQFADAILDKGFSVAVLQGCEYPVPFWMLTQDRNREVSSPQMSTPFHLSAHPLLTSGNWRWQ